jgi:uncharacterized protein (DUF486 family)
MIRRGVGGRFDDSVSGSGPSMPTVLLLIISNIFMTFAWYGHLKFKQTPLWIAIAASWLIALLEYCFQVPANRLGHGRFTTTQLKVMQEVITLAVFCVFVVLYMKEKLSWNYLAAFACLIAAVWFVFGFPAPAADASADNVESPRT